MLAVPFPHHWGGSTRLVPPADTCCLVHTAHHKVQADTGFVFASDVLAMEWVVSNIGGEIQSLSPQPVLKPGYNCFRVWFIYNVKHSISQSILVSLAKIGALKARTLIPDGLLTQFSKADNILRTIQVNVHIGHAILWVSAWKEFKTSFQRVVNSHLKMFNHRYWL